MFSQDVSSWGRGRVRSPGIPTRPDQTQLGRGGGLPGQGTHPCILLPRHVWSAGGGGRGRFCLVMLMGCCLVQNVLKVVFSLTESQVGDTPVLARGSSQVRMGSEWGTAQPGQDGVPPGQNGVPSLAKSGCGTLHPHPHPHPRDR